MEEAQGSTAAGGAGVETDAEKDGGDTAAAVEAIETTGVAAREGDISAGSGGVYSAKLVPTIVTRSPNGARRSVAAARAVAS